MRVLLAGAGGQLGRALRSSVPDSVALTALDRTGLDITSAESVHAAVAAIRPDCIVNAAAYTAVDAAEANAGDADRCNHLGAANLAAAAAALPGVRLLQLSTDYVFDGASTTPYAPDAPTAPLNVYGRTKLAGEQAVLQQLGDRATVLRVEWLYAAAGRNFVHTMLRLMRERGEVRVVGDQVGSPTAVRPLADVVWRWVARPDLSGVFHWTDAGVASWYDFAVAIAEEATARGLVGSAVRVRSIGTADFPTPARRPRFSVFDWRLTARALQIEPEHWRVRLREVLDEIRQD